MSLNRKSRAGRQEGDDAEAPPCCEAHYWRLVVLFGLALLILGLHAVFRFAACFPRQDLNPPSLYDRMVWKTGLPEGEGLCQVDWLEQVTGMPQEELPRLAGVHFTEGRQVIVSSTHPRAALLLLQPIPLNLADVEVLAALPGIGPALAARIVAKREELGGFQSMGQLRQVRGIGDKTLKNLQERLTL